MPIYEYECTRCGHGFEEERSISAPPRQRCPRCRGRVQKLVSQPAIMFKGSGFYATDSRRQGGNGKPAPAPAETTGAAPAAGEKTAPAGPAPDQGDKPAPKKKENKVA